jgi:hypothetical protein
MITDRLDQGLEAEGQVAHPFGQGGAAERQARSGVDVALAIERTPPVKAALRGVALRRV